MMMPAWASDYVGIPFAPRGRDLNGLDCWGLIRLVYLDRYGICLPSVPEYEDLRDHALLSRLVEHERRADWLPVSPGAEREGDGIILRMIGRPIHIGLVLAPGWMLHARAGSLSCAEQYTSQRWRSRVDGIYRHRELAHA